MSLDSSEVRIEDHLSWLCRALDDPSQIMWLGISDGEEKVGICRFEFTDNAEAAQVSINLNPKFRGKGLGAALLLDCSNRIQNSRRVNLMARIKKENQRSLKIFSRCGFRVTEDRASIVNLQRRHPPPGDFQATSDDIYFREVSRSDDDIDKLFELLGSRGFAISRDIGLTPERHRQFVQNHPYRSWYLVWVGEQLIGTVYLSHENVIGINLLGGQTHWVDPLLRRIAQMHNPLPEIPSVRPGYFYVNVHPHHHAMLEELETRGYTRIQDSFRVLFD